MKVYLYSILFLALTALSANAQDGFDPTPPGEPNALYRITVGISHSAAGTVSGGGSFAEGTRITIRRNDTGFNSSATVYYKFKCWMLNGEEYTQAGTSSSFTYTVDKKNAAFQAVYEVLNPDEVSSRLYLVSEPKDACTFNVSNGVRYLEGNSVYLYYNTTSSTFKFQGWYNGDELVTKSNYFYYTIGEDDATLTARFTYEPTIPGEPSGNQENVDCEDEEKTANDFRTTHITILSKTIDDVAVSDIESIETALNAYAELSDAAKGLLESEKSHLDSLKARAEELKAAEEADAAATAEAETFKTDNAEILDLTTSTVQSSDLDAINAALEAYNQLSDAAKEKVATEKSLLDALKARAEELKRAEEADAAATAEAETFKTDNAAILALTTSTISSSDLDAINAALEAYNQLSDAAKVKVATEKSLLDALKATAEELKAAEEGTDVITTDISQMTDVLYSAEMKAKSGKQIVLPIYMKNSGAVTLFQTNVYLPDGFSFAKKANGKYAVSLIKDRLTDEDDNHVISSNVQKDGSLLILCSSQDNYTFDGKDGQVATVTIDVADDVEEGPYLIKLNNQKMVRPDNTGNNVAEYQVVLTVKNYTLGDVNDDGDIDGYDLVGISNLILGTNTDGLIRDAADVNSDGDVDGYDYVMEVNTILGTNASAAKGKNPTLTENALSALTIPTMNVAAGEQTQLAVGMECNGDVFTLVQTDIEFPEGVEPMLRNGRVVAKLTGECLGGADDHSISCVKQGSGKYRILIASQDNTGLTGKDGQLFTIGIETSKDMLPGMYDITLSNTKLVRANSTGVNPSDVTAMMVCTGTTGINGVEADNADEQMYNLNGQRVSKHAQRGIYISNGKKNVKQ